MCMKLIKLNETTFANPDQISTMNVAPQVKLCEKSAYDVWVHMENGDKVFVCIGVPKEEADQTGQRIMNMLKEV